MNFSCKILQPGSTFRGCKGFSECRADAGHHGRADRGQAGDPQGTCVSDPAKGKAAV